MDALQNRSYSELYRARNDRIRVGGFVPRSLLVVGEVLSSASGMCIPCSCPLARIRPLAGRFVPTEVVAVRVPLRCFSGLSTGLVAGFVDGSLGFIVGFAVFSV